MNIEAIGRMVLAFAQSFLIAQGKADAAAYIKSVTAAYDSGKNIDAHLQTVAEYLEGGGEPDWADLKGRMDAELAELLGSPD